MSKHRDKRDRANRKTQNRPGPAGAERQSHSLMLGMTIGVALGLGFGILFGQIAVGMAVGLGIGTAIGLALGSGSRK